MNNVHPSPVSVIIIDYTVTHSCLISDISLGLCCLWCSVKTECVPRAYESGCDICLICNKLNSGIFDMYDYVYVSFVVSRHTIIHNLKISFGRSKIAESVVMQSNLSAVTAVQQTKKLVGGPSTEGPKHTKNFKHECRTSMSQYPCPMPLFDQMVSVCDIGIQ